MLNRRDALKAVAGLMVSVSAVSLIKASPKGGICRLSNDMTLTLPKACEFTHSIVVVNDGGARCIVNPGDYEVISSTVFRIKDGVWKPRPYRRLEA